MVRIEEATGRDKAAQEKLDKLVLLARKHFNSDYVSSTAGIVVHVKTPSVPNTSHIADINFAYSEMTLYLRTYFPNAKRFAEEYEEKFPDKGEFLIQTDYSGKR